MPPLEAFGPSLAIGLILVVMLWFAIGTQRNVRRGNDVLRWLHDGLPTLGARTTLRWLGSSAVELGIAQATPPFRDATVVVVLEPRDVPLLWAIARYRGRRDFLIVRANLVRAPRFTADVRDPAGWTGRGGPASQEDMIAEGASTADWPGGRAVLANNADTPAVRAAWDQLAASSAGIWRLSVQPVVPHLEVHLRPAPLETAGSERVIGAIKQLAAALTR
jgi:hypothetical protein